MVTYVTRQTSDIKYLFHVGLDTLVWTNKVFLCSPVFTIIVFLFWNSSSKTRPGPLKARLKLREGFEGGWGWGGWAVEISAGMADW